MSITVYYSSVSGSREVKQHQSEILQFLDAKKIKYFAVDIAGSGDLKEEMRKKVGNPSAMPPQVFNGDKYCGVSLI
ncbi:SH3 domain-binding glutamic acid-rich-like protein 3 [Sinocyclocheilus rhinocerous]|uniref:SH3 domain-binding glutamic acid-rich-like protein 3 n=1 Tax=Sinocyclocheilus rhinocerous TaxID=307959 RepID=UPI0007B9E45A|nr:PREDICTED: SH3 domain-binding glutamic acid-rich-like protein 3 [Sinocyclocheilus rhinocerous]XP_016387957.1 PREDICTED: SH3 domain-binding glutamic acid-rich-like protein 3 [Sinocyclocheilus rhinocerous]XP_016387958.1 PREDICTED: SH3 domain-binding glutamic acid-rich-like protein 3 [Sinocyclocheilus rhinocerous]XP_016387959.1 PREDICTED: SH3 domain-binding glutamic acid-rich-like protein 3 [Sinocyclocheilus rhinocerous]